MFWSSLALIAQAERESLFRPAVDTGYNNFDISGLEADQRVIAAHQCYAMTATTALTVQNTQGVQDIHYVPSSIVHRQIDACIKDIGVDVVKVGERRRWMLATL